MHLYGLNSNFYNKNFWLFIVILHLDLNFLFLNINNYSLCKFYALNPISLFFKILFWNGMKFDFKSVLFTCWPLLCFYRKFPIGFDAGHCWHWYINNVFSFSTHLQSLFLYLQGSHIIQLPSRYWYHKYNIYCIYPTCLDVSYTRLMYRVSGYFMWLWNIILK